MSFALKTSRENKSALAVQYLKGKVNYAVFTANVFSIVLNDKGWRLSGLYLDTAGVQYKIQLDIPKRYEKGVYKLKDHSDIKITYTTTDLTDPLTKNVREGLLDLIEVDPGNNHIAGALAGGLTAEDGDGLVFPVDFLFSFG